MRENGEPASYLIALVIALTKSGWATSTQEQVGKVILRMPASTPLEIQEAVARSLLKQVQSGITEEKMLSRLKWFYLRVDCINMRQAAAQRVRRILHLKEQ